jgi:hypothetical protein
MATDRQTRWRQLLDILHQFDFLGWFEDELGIELIGLANRISEPEHIPLNADQLRLDAAVWCRDDWIYTDIQQIAQLLSNNPDYDVELSEDTLRIKLVDRSAPTEVG